VDCIRVSTVPIKSIIDDHIQRLFDALLGSLRRSAQAHVTAIDVYLTGAMDTLSQRPQSVEEIAEANSKHVDIYKNKKEVSTRYLGFFYKINMCTLLHGLLLNCILNHY